MPGAPTASASARSQERIRTGSRIESLLFTQGIRERPSLRTWDRDLAALRTADGRALPPNLRAELDRLRRRLGLTLELICEIEAEREATLAAAPPEDDACWKITALSRIRGLGDNFATVLTREVFCRHFSDRRRLAGHVGIAPMPHQSGAMDRDRRISRAGNPRARKALIQLAWLWLRYQPGSALARWFRERVGTLAGRTRRIAIVAIARKLLVALRRCIETGVVPDGAEQGASRIDVGGMPTGVEEGSATVFLIGGLTPPRFRWVAPRPGPGLVHEAFRCGPQQRPDRMQGDAASAAGRDCPGPHALDDHEKEVRR